jgi:hypothetical protein
VRVHERVHEGARDERAELGEAEPDLGGERAQGPAADELGDEVAVGRPSPA